MHEVGHINRKKPVLLLLIACISPVPSGARCNVKQCVADIPCRAANLTPEHWD
jgi:hypothetical protein